MVRATAAMFACHHASGEKQGSNDDIEDLSHSQEIKIRTKKEKNVVFRLSFAAKYPRILPVSHRALMRRDVYINKQLRQIQG